jgi:hypothetical protein
MYERIGIQWCSGRGFAVAGDRRCAMTDVAANPNFDEIYREIGPDVTAMFAGFGGNLTEHASGEALESVLARNVDDDRLEELDDDDAAEEEEDEEDEEEDAEDEADDNG